MFILVLINNLLFKLRNAHVWTKINYSYLTDRTKKIPPKTIKQKIDSNTHWIAHSSISTIFHSILVGTRRNKKVKLTYKSSAFIKLFGFLSSQGRYSKL